VLAKANSGLARPFAARAFIAGPPKKSFLITCIRQGLALAMGDFPCKLVSKWALVGVVFQSFQAWHRICPFDQAIKSADQKEKNSATALADVGCVLGLSLREPESGQKAFPALLHRTDCAKQKKGVILMVDASSKKSWPKIRRAGLLFVPGTIDHHVFSGHALPQTAASSEWIGVSLANVGATSRLK